MNTTHCVVCVIAKQFWTNISALAKMISEKCFVVKQSYYLFVFVSVISNTEVYSEEYIWSPTGVESSGGNGIWDTTSPLWYSEGMTHSWVNAPGNNAWFSGIPGTVIINEAVNVQNLNFSTSDYTLTGGSIINGSPLFTGREINISNGMTATINSLIEGGGLSASPLIIKNGGKAIFTGTNTYSNTNTSTGNPFLRAGAARSTIVIGNSTLQVDRDTNLGAAPTTFTNGLQLGDSTGRGTLFITGDTFTTNRNVLLGPGATEGLGGRIDADVGVTAIFNGQITSAVSNVTQLTIGGPGTVVLNAVNNYAGKTTVLAGSTLQAGNHNTTTNMLGSINSPFHNDGTLIIDRLSGTLVKSGGMTGGETGRFIIRGGGNVSWAGDNTYSGDTIIEAGNLTVGTAFAGDRYQSSHVHINNINSVLGINAGSSDITYPGEISGVGGLRKLAGSTLILTGNNTFEGATTISAGTVQIGDGGTHGSISSNVALSIATATLAFARADNISFGSVISGLGKLSQTGSGTLTLNGNNTYAGGTTIMAGNVQIASDSNLGAATGMLTFSGDSTLEVLANLTSSRATILNATRATLDVNDGATLVMGGVIDGPGVLYKTDSGTLTLTNTNTYRGGTNISGGRIQISGDANLGELSSRLTLDNATLETASTFSTTRMTTLGPDGGTFDTRDATSFTMTGAIEGSGSLTKEGEGNLTLTGTNLYAGVSTLLGGTLMLKNNGSIATSANVINNGQLDISGTTNGTSFVSLDGNGTVIMGAKNLTLSEGAGLFSGQFSGTGHLNKQGNATQLLSGMNSYAGAVDVSAGTLQFEQNGNFTTSDYYTTHSHATTTLTGVSTTLMVGGAFTQASNAHLAVMFDGLSGLSPRITAQSASLDGTLGMSGFIDRPVAVKASEATTHNYTLIHTTNGISGNFTNNPLAPSGADYLIRDGYVSADGQDYNLGFRLAWTGEKQTLSTGNFTLSEGTGFDIDQVLSDQTVPVGGFLTGWDGRSLTKEGEGRLVLSAVNTYNGATTLNAGLLQTGVAESFAHSSDLNVNGGVLDLNGYSQIASRLAGLAGEIWLNGATLTANNATDGDSTLFAGVITDGTRSGGGLVKAGKGTLILTGNHTYGGSTTINDGTLQVGNGGTSGSIAGNIIDNSSLVFNRSDVLTFDGGLSGTGKLIQEGRGNTILTASGSHLGEIEVRKGILTFEQNGAFTLTKAYSTASGATTALGLAQSQLAVGGRFTQAHDATLQAVLSADKALPAIIAETATLDGQLIVTGFQDGPTPVKASRVTDNNYTLIHTSDGITGHFLNNPLLPSGTDYLLRNGYVSDNGQDYVLGFRLAWTEESRAAGTGSFTLAEGTGMEIDHALTDQPAPVDGFASGWDGKSLTKAGDGRLVLSAANTYTGYTLLEAGALQTDIAHSFAHSSDVIINGGVLDINGYDQVASDLAGHGGEIRLNGAILTVRNAAPADSTTFFGDITDGTQPGGKLRKTGEGTLTLVGNTGWSGETLLENGELILDGRNGGARLISNVIGLENTRLVLKHGAVLTGRIDPTDVSIDVVSLWNMTGDSQVDELRLAGRLNIVAPSQRGVAVGRTLTVANWYGLEGTVMLNTVLGNDRSVTDKIVVNGNTSGKTFVQINNPGGGGAQTVEGIRIIDVNGTSAGTFVKAGRIVAGAYDYNLIKKGPDWFLSSAQGGIPAEPGSPEPTKPVPNIVRPESASYTANLSASNTMFTTRLHERVGETLYTDAMTGDRKKTSMWLRQVGEHTRWKENGGQLNTQSNRYVIQLGGDVARWESDDLQSWHLGIMAGYGRDNSHSRSDPTGYSAEGSVNGYSTGLYLTWYQNEETKQGMYTDSWVQYSWFDNDVKGQHLQDESYKSSGFTTSFEVGYAYKLGEFISHNDMTSEWYIQPQAQIIWMGIEAEDHRESNGTTVSGQGDNNLQTRLGLRAHLRGHSKIDEAKNRIFQPFLEINWIHNTKKFGTRMDGMNVYQEGVSNIGEVKTGVEGQVSRKVNLWANVGVEIGDKGYSNTTAMMGIQYQF
ncbi:autotransporter outer membrane beta-barrel domain-containing protein [Citrobacter gillenii]|uniref:Autotransporter outer membrane beta-barrel domain-containing protein n=2 Tax=Citrobacter gillenii TaxID=67828 RepID=A0ABD6M4L3_9ENTR|nr:autotransporter outer membrane beta-barrel domain-containing protein [Citrobacter gillenii]